MLDPSQIEEARGCDAFGCDGVKIGTLVQLYSRDRACRPAWATVRTGQFGSGASFVPLYRATFSNQRLRLAYTEREVLGAPRVSSDVLLTAEQEQDLYAYYGLDHAVTPDQSLAGISATAPVEAMEESP